MTANERNRRHQQARRQPQSSQSVSQYHNQHADRSIYHGHPADTYSTSNYRHPSTTTTTTTTDHSSLAQRSRSSSECSGSIWYSYLIAIISSFLFALGIYLSITRFNTHFLYLSLVGLSIEAVGACIYCVSNIHSSKLARRKQRINSDEFILNGGGNITESGNFDNNLHRQQQITTITHILNNRTLTSGTTAQEVNENSSAAINTDNDIQSTQSIQLMAQFNDERQATSNECQSEEATNNSCIVVLNRIQQKDQLDSAACLSSNRDTSSNELQLPNKRTYRQQSPEATSGEFLSSSSLLDSRNDPMNEQIIASNQIDSSTDNHRQNPSQLSINMVSQFNSHLGDNNNFKSKTPAYNSPSEQVEAKTSVQDENRVELNDHDEIQSSPQSQDLTALVDSTTRIEPSAPISGENRDLIDLQQRSVGLVASSSAADPLQVTKRSSQSHSRPANLRRTLVMGLSGEEEIIEIDEADLDNMSILPPSYESIAANKIPPSS